MSKVKVRQNCARGTKYMIIYDSRQDYKKSIMCCHLNDYPQQISDSVTSSSST